MRPLAFFIAAMICTMASCRQSPAVTNVKTSAPVVDSVQWMMKHLTQDLARTGPLAWLNYFDPAPDFYMVSDGKLAFQNFAGARLFIEDTLVHSISKINLAFSQQRIDSLGPQLASVGAVFHEDLTSTSANSFPVDGYFTALVTQTPQGWKIRNLHWSITKTK